MYVQMRNWDTENNGLIHLDRVTVELLGQSTIREFSRMSLFYLRRNWILLQNNR
jgi:hypothetical protein